MDYLRVIKLVDREFDLGSLAVASAGLDVINNLLGYLGKVNACVLCKLSTVAFERSERVL